MNNLDKAKKNLRDTIERLENAVEKKLEQTQNSLALDTAKKIETLNQEITDLHKNYDDKKDEISHLREENSKLQAEVGQGINLRKEMEIKNRETAKRIDELIAEVKNYLADKGLI